MRHHVPRHRASSSATQSSAFKLTLLITATILSSCKGNLPDEGGKPPVDAVNDIADDTVQVVDVGTELNINDIVAIDASVDSAPLDSTVDSCPGGEGCPCTGNDTCDNGVCLDTHDGKRCARACVDACPAGYSCQKYGSVDGAFFCVSSHLSLCAPCETHAECQVDGVLALCIAYGSEGSFCGAPCKADGDCPGGYECKDADDGKGGTAKQCHRQAGKNCECSAWAKDKTAKTTCTVSNDIGVCTASRKCAADGLEACAAKLAAPEVCNGQDDDCDGVTDVLAPDAKCFVEAFAGGGSGTACKTDEDCPTAGEACDESVGKCDLLIGACPGEALCVNGKEVCLKAKTPELESCNNKDDDCDGQTDEAFAINLPDGATASVGAACGVGACAGGTVECVSFNKAACSTVGDEADKDSCNGKDDDCDGETDEGACDDSDACTTDACDAANAVCSHTAAVDCDDGEACTQDTCDPKTGSCGHDGAALAGQDCDDGDACTEADACAEGKCAPGKAKGCDDANPCTDDGCDKQSGCANLANLANCSDGDACTNGDGCKEGKCAPGLAVKCDDGEGCTDDACDVAKGCVATPIPGSCSDGDACTAGDACKGGKCEPGAAVNCDDGETCTADSCDKAAGCVHVVAEEACSDGDACTAGDSCKGGKCAPGSAVECDDGEVCTANSCDKAAGCTTLPAQASCTDGDACTQGDNCDGGKCAPGSAVNCDDGEACTADSCDKTAGCVHLAAQASCTDGDACTGGDACAASKCVPGNAVNCDDGNACTDDVCVKAAGCMHASNAGPCDDGSDCTWADTCDAGGCVAGPPALFGATYGGGSDDRANAIAPLVDGGFVLAGWTTSTNLPGGQKSLGNRDAWLVRTNGTGKLLWNRTYGGSGNDQVHAVVKPIGGGFVLAGSTTSTDLPEGQKSAGGNDFWLVRVKPDGAPQWSRTYGGSGDEAASAAAVLSDGGLALVGWTTSADLPSGKSAGGRDFWLVRTDAAGKLLWSHAYGGKGGETGNAVAALGDGGFALAGSTSSEALPGGPGSAGGDDFWLARTDAVGKLLWSRTYGGASTEMATSVTAVTDGGLALAGYANSKILPGVQQPAGGSDFWLVRTDSGGQLMWSRTYGGKGDEYATSVLALTDGGLALTGSTNSTSLPGGKKTVGGNDFWLVRTNPEGQLLWSRTFGGLGVDNALALSALPNDGFALVGSTTSVDLPDGQKTGGGEDAWLVRVDPWGHRECGEAGGCVSKTMADCDDGDPCTIDTCHEANGACGNFQDAGSCSSCSAIKAASPSSLDGYYVVDVDGAGPIPPAQVYCDMTTDGGGWTLCANATKAGAGFATTPAANQASNFDFCIDVPNNGKTSKLAKLENKKFGLFTWASPNVWESATMSLSHGPGVRGWGTGYDLSVAQVGAANHGQWCNSSLPLSLRMSLHTDVPHGAHMGVEAWQSTCNSGAFWKDNFTWQVYTR